MIKHTRSCSLEEYIEPEYKDNNIICFPFKFSCLHQFNQFCTKADATNIFFFSLTMTFNLQFLFSFNCSVRRKQILHQGCGLFEVDFLQCRRLGLFNCEYAFNGISFPPHVIFLLFFLFNLFVCSNDVPAGSPEAQLSRNPDPLLDFFELTFCLTLIQ